MSSNVDILDWLVKKIVEFGWNALVDLFFRSAIVTCLTITWKWDFFFRVASVEREEILSIFVLIHLSAVHQNRQLKFTPSLSVNSFLFFNNRNLDVFFFSFQINVKQSHLVDRDKPITPFFFFISLEIR